MTADIARDARALLADLYRHAVQAVDPAPALRAALAPLPPPAAPVHCLALGKAAHPMAQAAVAHLASLGAAPAGGVVVAPDAGPAPHPALTVVVGDHPEPGAGSLAAAEAVARAVAAVRSGDEAWVLLSGGTTALVGAPGPGIAPDELRQLYALLLGSGLDIARMNRIRKRFTRWSGGRLAVALAHAARVRVFVVSDVNGDDLAAIGSGPCYPDASTATEVRAALSEVSLWERIPATLRHLVARTEAGELAETPKPGDAAFRRVETTFVASNHLAVEAAAQRARALALRAHVHAEPLAGEASEMGRFIGGALRKYQNSQATEVGTQAVLIWGGETTVTLGAEHGLGGRSQELALSAAEVLGGSAAITLLAAGTDGRDGPTDAAGAIVDGKTWGAIAAAGRDPARDLARHDAYTALDAAGALLRPGMTGTNVMDLVMAVVGGR